MKTISSYTSFNDILEELLSKENMQPLSEPVYENSDNKALMPKLCYLSIDTFLNISDESLQTISKDTKKKSLEYLKIIKARYDDLVEIAMTRVSKVQPKEKTLDEMSKEELIAYIKENFSK